MNAYAALLAGAGATPPIEAAPTSPLDSTGGEGDLDFFVVLQGTLEAPGSEAMPENLGEYTIDDGSQRLEGEGPTERPIEVPVEVHAEPLEFDWIAPLDGDDRIPMLESEWPTETRATSYLASTQPGTPTEPKMALEPHLLMSTDGGDALEAALASHRARLINVGTVGDGATGLPASGPAAMAPDPSKLTGSVGSVDLGAVVAPGIVDDPDLSLIDPELRARLETVIDRMRTEYGHNVKVVEGYRTPDRQQSLFAQGRTAPGPVVTWTQNSLHSEGLAVDVIVDGSYAPHEGYRRLARIAAEEGLETLGPRDPGHLQLPRQLADGAGEARPTPRIAQVDRPATLEAVATVSEPAQVALRASIAEPAAVAQPAAVGQPAEVAVPGSEGTAPPSDFATPTLAAVESETATDDRRSSSRGDREDRRAALASTDRPSPAASRNPEATEARFAATGPDAANALASTDGSGSMKTPTMVSAEALHRVTQVREIQELAYPKKLGQVTLRMLDGLSEEARLRVSLMSDGVATSIGVRDLAQADRMRSRIATLEQALRQRGLESVSVKVSALSGSPVADVAALTAGAVNAARTSSEADGFMNGDLGSQQRSDSDERNEAHNSEGDRPSPEDYRQEDPS